MADSKPVGPRTPGSGLKSFNISSANRLQVRVHPVAVLTILDSYVRRPEGAKRTIGTLLGSPAEGRPLLEITDCFAVVHQDTEDRGVLMDQDYHRQMLALRQKVSPKEQVVGWFSTGDEITDSSVVVHSFYCTKESHFQPSLALPSPVHLLVNTSLAKMSLAIKAYVHAPTKVASSLAQFHEVPLEISQGSQAEKAGTAMLLQARGVQHAMRQGASAEEAVRQQAQTEGLAGGLANLLELLKKARGYTQKVMDGELDGDHRVGRSLTRTLCAEPIFDLEAVQNLCQGALQDTLMVVYLSNLTRTQISLAERINAEYADLF